MDQIQLSARLKVHDGKLEEFFALCNECISIVREKEPSSLQYQYFFHKETSEMVVRETYADSNGLLAHMGNVGEPLGKLLGMSDPFIEVYGNASDQLKGALAGLPTSYHEYFRGK